MGDMIRDILAVANAFAQFKLGQKQLSDYEEKRRQEALQAVWERQQQERNLALQGERVGLERERFDLSRQQTEEDQKRYMTKLQMDYAGDIADRDLRVQEMKAKQEAPRQALLKQWNTAAPQAAQFLLRYKPTTPENVELHQQAMQLLWGPEVRQQKSEQELSVGLGRLQAITETLQGQKMPDTLLEDAAAIRGALESVRDQLPKPVQEVLDFLGEAEIAQLPREQLGQLLATVAAASGGLVKQTAGGRYIVQPDVERRLSISEAGTPAAKQEVAEQADLEALSQIALSILQREDPAKLTQEQKDRRLRILAAMKTEEGFGAAASEIAMFINDWYEHGSLRAVPLKRVSGRWQFDPTTLNAQRVQALNLQLAPLGMQIRQGQLGVSQANVGLRRQGLADRRKEFAQQHDLAERKFKASSAARPAGPIRSAPAQTRDPWSLVW